MDTGCSLVPGGGSNPHDRALQTAKLLIFIEARKAQNSTFAALPHVLHTRFLQFGRIPLATRSILIGDFIPRTL
jgi:hypothetical protein